MSIKAIITNIKELRIPCLAVEKNEDIKQIIIDLKDTLESTKGLGLSANQIGYNKRVSYLKVPIKVDPKTKEIEYTELILINAKIVEKTKSVKIMNEACLSFPGITITTQRYIFIVVENYNEQLEVNMMLLQDNESLVCQRELDHLAGRTILDRKWRAK
jgi:peptide deformylase